MRRKDDRVQVRVDSKLKAWLSRHLKESGGVSSFVNEQFLRLYRETTGKEWGDG